MWRRVYVREARQSRDRTRLPPLGQCGPRTDQRQLSRALCGPIRRLSVRQNEATREACLREWGKASASEHTDVDVSQRRGKLHSAARQIGWGRTNAIRLESVLQRECVRHWFWCGRRILVNLPRSYRQNRIQGGWLTKLTWLMQSRIGISVAFRYCSSGFLITNSREEILPFIKEYEKKEVLWKKDTKDYHNILKKEDAWQEISSIMAEEVDVLKKKKNVKSSRITTTREK